MAEARCREQWAHTSHVLAAIANANRDRKKRRAPFSPEDFNPYVQSDRRRERERQRRENPEYGFSVLKSLVLSGQFTPQEQ